MAFAEDEPVKKPKAHVVGEDVSLLSVEDLAARVAALEAEIARLKAEMDRRGDVRRAADSLFRL